jgi:hypothetical protein
MANQALEFIGSYAPKTQGNRSAGYASLRPRIAALTAFVISLCVPQIKTTSSVLSGLSQTASAIVQSNW